MIYGIIADWRTYAAARGNSAPTDAADIDATASLQRASDYIRTRYALRLGLGETDEAVVEATYIAASYDLEAPGFWQKTFTPAQAKVLTKVDAIQWSTVDSDVKGADAMLPTSPAIDALFMSTRSTTASLFVV